MPWRAVLTCQLDQPDETLFWVVEELVARFLDNVHFRSESFKPVLSPIKVAWFLTQESDTEGQVEPLTEDIFRRQGVNEVGVQLAVAVKMILRPTLSGISS